MLCMSASASTHNIANVICSTNECIMAFMYQHICTTQDNSAPAWVWTYSPCLVACVVSYILNSGGKNGQDECIMAFSYLLNTGHQHSSMSLDTYVSSIACHMHNAGRKNGQDARWLQQVRRSGTTSDKVAALTLLLQESAVANLKSLDALLNWVLKRKGGRNVVAQVFSWHALSPNHPSSSHSTTLPDTFCIDVSQHMTL